MTCLRLLLPIALMAPLAAAERTWTDHQGRTILAELVRVDGDMVVLNMGDREIEYPLAKLSEKDQQFAKAQAAIPEENAPPESPLVRTADFDAPMPARTGPPPEFEVTTVREDKEADEYVYSSEHFDFVSDRRLTSRVVSGFALLYEATYEAIRQMPWGTTLDPGTETNRFLVRLFAEEETFLQAGGIPGSAGTAIGPLSLAQLQYLGVRDTGSRLILEDINDNKVVVHELAHALRDKADRGLPVWAVEGFAEMIACAPYQRGGRFDFSDPIEAAADYGLHYKRVGDPFRPPLSLEKMLNASRSTFYMSAEGGLGEGAGANYISALLALTYFWHVDQGKDDAKEIGAPVRAWLKAIRDGTTEEDARPLLLDGRTYEEIERAIANAYRRKIEIAYD